MDTINTRIAGLIRESKKTKTEWAGRLNVTPQFVSSLCNGKKMPSDRTIADICREFNVSETWLRTGEGEMFVQKAPLPLDELLAELLGGKTVTEADKVLVKNFLELPGASRKAVIEFVQACSMGLSAPAQPDASGPEQTQTDIAAELAELKRQNQELAAKVAAMEEEDALLGLTDVSSKSPSVSVGSFSPAQKAKK